jgi:anti-anti-sigma factor
VTTEPPTPAAFPPFVTELHATGDEAVLRIRGEIDLATEDALREAIDALLESGADDVVIDLRDVDYMDSTGVQRLLAAQFRAEEAGLRLRMRLGRPARRILLLCGVLPRLSLTDEPATPQDGS